MSDDHPRPGASSPSAAEGGVVDRAYDPDAIADKLYADWDAAGLFHAEPGDDGEPFSIVIPPPNVTGSLHVGHALDNSIQDAIIRRQRMQGANAVWVPGTDHAGIATQNVVERQLEDEGMTRHDLGRDAFVQRVWQWREESGGIILEQLRKLGASCDWQREAFTFDEPRSRAVREVFVSLYEQDLIYRGYRLINWCPRCATALSDIEVEHEETVGEMVHIRYPPAAGDGDGVVVATTRAETMLGDTAVAVHPDDDRYRDLVGATLRLPLMGREIPVVADELVDPEFGTGAVKVTPAHDETDHAIAQHHGLDVVDIMNDDATINDNGGRFAGMDRFEARAAVKRALEDEDVLVKIDEHEHAVGHCERCDTVVEPRLSEQWFVAVSPLAGKAIGAVHDGRVRFVPERFTKGFLEWLENLHDWCISRQIWWGHRIPAWYCPDGHVTVARETPDGCTTCGRGELHQDEDVLDTWFSSQLWPFTVFGWPEDTPELATWFPTSVLVTGYDINTFWVSRMLMIALWFLDEVPFHVVHNHGMVRDRHGKKMSKSFGNVIDPLDFIDRYGADALRHALFSRCSPGSDVPLAEDWVEGGRRYANKLWNATRFALQNLDATPSHGPDALAGLPAGHDLALEDRWVLSRLEAARHAADAAYDRYDWAAAAQSLYHFAWDEFADWYVEATKVRLHETGHAGADTARRVLATVLDDLLRLLHPLMPFVTEALWRSLTGSDGGGDSLMVAAWPGPRRGRDEDAEASFAVLQQFVGAVRRFRSDHQIAPSTAIPATVVTTRRATLEPLTALATSLAGLGEVTFADHAPDDRGFTRVAFPDGEIHIPVAGVIDVAGELERLARELDTAIEERQRAERKLANEDFVERAPEDVVQRERDKRQEWQEAIDRLRGEMAELEALAG